MAEIGKGDPRWIVKERCDGANVNNWHWTEKNISVWAKEKFAEIVERKKADVAGVEFKVKSYTGDCGLLNRKKKLVFYYQITFELEWAGEGVKGTVKVEEVDQDEDDFSLQIEAKRPEGDPKKCLELLTAVKTKGKPYITSLLQCFNEEIKSFMEQGGSLSPKSPPDDFSDLDQPEQDEFITHDAAFTSTPAVPVSHPVKVTIKKSAESDPMGALIDPDTLEVLEVKEATPSHRSLLKHCVGMHVRSINGTPIGSMDELLSVAKAAKELVLTVVDGNYEKGDFEQGVATCDTLLSQSGLTQGLKTAFLYNRGLNRYRKMLAGGVKSGIMRNAAVSDLRNAFGTGVPPDEAATYGRAWVMTKAAVEDSSLVEEALRVSHDHPHLIYSFCYSLPLSAFAGRPLSLWNAEAVRPFFVSRVVSLVADEQAAKHVKGSFGSSIRSTFRGHADPTHRTLARKVGAILRDAK